MYYLLQKPKRKIYMSGRGFVYQNLLNGDFLDASSKSKIIRKKQDGSGLSQVAQRLEREAEKGIYDAKEMIKPGVSTVKKVQGNLKNLVYKGEQIPNVEAVIEKVASSVSLSDVLPKQKGKKGNQLPLSELLNKKAKTGKGQTAKGLRLHGQQEGNGIRLNTGSGLKYV